MRKLIFVSYFTFVFVACAFGQNPEEIEILQNTFGLEKRAIVNKIMNLEEKYTDVFWSLYDEYEVERKSIGKEKIALIKDYADDYFNLSNEKVDEMFKRYIKIEKSYDQLLVKFYAKMKKQMNARTAAQFFQLENYFADIVNVQIATQIPTIGELE